MAELTASPVRRTTGASTPKNEQCEKSIVVLFTAIFLFETANASL